MEKEIEILVNQYDLLPHPEGGFYRETYRSSQEIPVSWTRIEKPHQRSLSTAILFLITGGNFSAFHRIRSDEVWHFYSGQSLWVHELSPEGIYTCTSLGNKPELGQLFQYVVPAGHWFASEVAAGGSYSLVGCTVSPGFDFADFELANREELLQTYPEQTALIKRLTRI